MRFPVNFTGSPSAFPLSFGWTSRLNPTFGLQKYFVSSRNKTDHNMMTSRCFAALIVLFEITKSSHGFMHNHNFFRSRHVNSFNVPTMHVPRTCGANRFKAAVDITDLATSTLHLLQCANETATQYNIIVKALHSLDKSLALEHQQKIMKEEDKLHYYKRLASFIGQRSALEEFFRKIVAITKANKIKIFEPVYAYYLEQEGIGEWQDQYGLIRAGSGKYLTEVISNDPLPQMKQLNHFVAIPQVRAVLQSLIGYEVDVPVFEGRLISGVLPETENDSEIYDSICVAPRDPHLAFFAEIARLLQKPFERYDPVRAYAGQCAVRMEKGMEITPGKLILP